MFFNRHIVAALRGERGRTGDGHSSSTADTDNRKARACGEPSGYRDHQAQQHGVLKEALPEGQKSMTQRARFATFLAERQFSRDLAFALWLPLVLAAFVARSCDAPGAGPAACEKGKVCGLALSSFPCGAHAARQLLHVLRHLPWYLLVRPARVGDWVGLLSNAHHLAFTSLVLVLAAARRQGRLWDWWRRHRVLAAWSTSRGGSTLMHLASYPLLPRPRWPDAVVGPYTLLVSTHPMLSILIYCALDSFVGFPFLSAVAGSLLHATAVWGVAYTVAPSLIHMEQQRSAGLDGFTAGGSSPTVPFAHPLRCDNPRVAALVSCCPAWQQCCLAAFLVAFPIALAAGSQRWLWARYRQTLPRSHRASHASCAQNDHKRRQQQQQQQQEQHQLVEQRDKAQKQSLIELHRPPDPHGVVELVPAGATDDLAALPDPLFDSWIWSRAITVKVLQHQGSREEFGPQLASAVRQAVQEPDRRRRRPPLPLPPLQVARRRPPSHIAAGDRPGTATASPNTSRVPSPPPPQPSKRPVAEALPQLAAATTSGGSGSGARGGDENKDEEEHGPAAAAPAAPAGPVADTPEAGSVGGNRRRGVGGARAPVELLGGSTVLHGCTQLIMCCWLLPPPGPQRQQRGSPAEPHTPTVGDRGGGGSTGALADTGAGEPSHVHHGGPDTGKQQYEHEHDCKQYDQKYDYKQYDQEYDYKKYEEEFAKDIAAELLETLPSSARPVDVCVQVGGAGPGARLRVGCGQGPGEGPAAAEAVRLLRMHPPALELTATRGSLEVAEGVEPADYLLVGASEGAATAAAADGDGQHGEQREQGLGGMGGDVAEGQEVTQKGDEQEAGQQEQGQGQGSHGQQLEGDGKLNLLLFSPVAQPARLVVVRQGPGGVAEVVGEESQVPTGLVVAELPVHLRAGEQEVGVDLGGVVRELAEAGTAQGEGRSYGVQAEVLQLLLLPPVHEKGSGREGAEGSHPKAAAGAGGVLGSGGGASGGGAPVPPLLHFAVPLLLLPAESVEELCELEGRMRADVQEQQALGAAVAEPPAPTTANPAQATMAAGPGADYGYWRAHMEPLLQHLNAVLLAGGIGDLAWVTDALLPGLLDFLRGQRMGATERLLVDRQQQPPPSPPPQQQQQQLPQEAPLPAGMSLPTLHGQPAQGASGGERAAAAHTAPAAGPGTSPQPSHSPTAHVRAGEATAAAVPTPSSPSAGHLLHGFSPPALERQFRAWRAASLARAALPLMLLAAVPHLYALATSVWWALRGRQPQDVAKAAASEADWWRLAFEVVLYFGSWAADVSGYVAVLLVIMRHTAAGGRPRGAGEGEGKSRTQQGKEVGREEQPQQGRRDGGEKGVGLQQQQLRSGSDLEPWGPLERHLREGTREQQQQQGPQLPGVSSPQQQRLLWKVQTEAAPKAPDSAAARVAGAVKDCDGTAMYASLSLDRAYARGAVVVGPLLLLLLSSAALLLQCHVPRLAVGNGGPSATLAIAATRAVTGPCAQQLTVRQVALASPVMMLGDALLLMLLRPEWGVGRVVLTSLSWRLAAFAFSACFEWRARRRFLA